MNSIDSSANGKSFSRQSTADTESGSTHGQPFIRKNGNAGNSTPGHWKVILEESIHLLGLFWVNCLRTSGGRATGALFTQLLHHLHILGRMPDHDGGILVRRVRCRLDNVRNTAPDYVILFGSIMINHHLSLEAQASGTKIFARAKSGLSQAFECFTEQNIHSLYLRIPGHSEDQIENFRFSMNVMPRYHAAAKDGTSIAFRYYGRTLTIPLITDQNDQPNPNLTLMAALNGLSVVNARELVRQAQAYHKISSSENEDAARLQPHLSSYDQIFRVRSLKTQIIRPPVEINNLYSPFEAYTVGDSPDTPETNGDNAASAAAFVGPAEQNDATAVKGAPSPGNDSGLSRQELSSHLGSGDPPIQAALDALYSDDYVAMDAFGLAKRFVSVTRLLYALDKHCQDPKVIELVLERLQMRLKNISDRVLANIITQRQGLKIQGGNRTVMVGLVHPRLFDLITLIREHVIAHQRIGLIKEIAFNVDPCHIVSLADGFGISTAEANRILGILKGCFVANGSFVRPTFESRVNAMSRHENVIFEILWCFLKQTPLKKDRLDFLNAIQLLMARLNDPKRALQFILADICQDPATIDFTDRNAFALANVLLHKENKELYIDVNRTPEDVLKIQRPLNRTVRQYANWRLEADKGRYLSKTITIAGWIHRVLMTSSGQDPGPFELRFLLALERELFIFSSLVEGFVSRIVLRKALSAYGDPGSEIYGQELTPRYLSLLIPHLQIIVRALGRCGNLEDIESLKRLEKNSEAFTSLDRHPAHGLRVKQMMKWVPQAIRTIYNLNNRP